MSAQETAPPSPTPTPTAGAEPGHARARAPPRPPALLGDPTYFNPAIAVIGNFLGVDRTQPGGDRPSLQLRESEVSLQAVVDPYARADFFLSFNERRRRGGGGLRHVPESALADLLVKVGQVQGPVRQGQHACTSTSCPGPTSLCRSTTCSAATKGGAMTAISVAQAHRPAGRHLLGDHGPGLPRETDRTLRRSVAQRDLPYNAQYRLFRDFGDDHNLEVGFSYGRGFNGRDRRLDDQPRERAPGLPLEAAPQAAPTAPSSCGASSSGAGASRTDRTQNVAGLLRRRRLPAREALVHGSARTSSPTTPTTAPRSRQGRRGDAHVLAERVLADSRASSASRRLRQRQIKANEALLQMQFAIGAHGAHPF